MQCVSGCVEKALTMHGADPGSTAESLAFCRFFLILCCLVYLSCQVNRHKTHRWITSVFIDFPETCLGRRSHAEDPPLHEACLPSLSTRNVNRHRHGHKWSSRSSLDKCFWTCNAAQHVFCPAIPKHKISMVHVEAFEQSSWACAAMRWLRCLSWGCLSCNYFNVKMGWLVLDLFFLQLVLLFLRKSSILIEFEGPNHWQVNYCHIAPVTCQAAATTVSVVPGMTFPSASIFSSSLGKYGKVLLDKPSSCSRICDLDSRDLYFVCCCTGMNIRTINYMHVYYLILFARCNTWEYQNISFHFHKLF